MKIDRLVHLRQKIIDYLDRIEEQLDVHLLPFAEHFGWIDKQISVMEIIGKSTLHIVFVDDCDAFIPLEVFDAPDPLQEFIYRMEARKRGKAMKDAAAQREADLKLLAALKAKYEA